MWRSLLTFLPTVPGHHLRVVDGKPLVGVHGHAEEPRVGLRTHEERIRMKKKVFGREKSLSTAFVVT